MLKHAISAKADVESCSASLTAWAVSEWNELLRHSDSDCLFLTGEWVQTWCKHLSSGRELSVMVVRQGEQLLALASFCVKGGWFPRAELPGSGFVGADYLDIVVRSGHEPEACALLADHLVSKPWVFRWNNLRRGDCAAEYLAAVLSKKGWGLVETAVNVCPYISLTGKNWESYLANLGSEHRYSFNRKYKRLSRDFKLEFRRAENAEECQRAIETLIELHKRRWRGRGGSDAFHTQALIDFHREFAQSALARGWLRLYTLTLDGRPAASLYGFFYNGKFYFYQSGFDPAYEKYSVGLVTMGLSIREAIEEGAVEYDLLHGDEPYKRHWSSERRTLSRIELYPPGVMGWLHSSTKSLARSARALLNSNVPARERGVA